MNIRGPVSKPAGTAIVLVLLGALFVISRFNYLFFHSLAEVFSIVVGFSIFVVAWNSRDFMNNNYLLFVGIAYLYVAGIDLLHALSYAGMGVFSDPDPDLPTQLWIAARMMQSISLLIAPALLGRQIRGTVVLAAFGLVTAAILASIFYRDIFPACYVEGAGLTPFKKISEYGIIGVFGIAGVLLYRKRASFAVEVRNWIYASLILAMLAELAFTFYIDVFGISNLVGHYLKILSFYYLYRALIVTGLARPFSLLVRDLKATEERLIEEKQQLEEALQNVKTLTGLLPICSGCKKIRDDQGYWNQLEIYIDSHSEATFTHGLCPECAGELYPDYVK